MLQLQEELFLSHGGTSTLVALLILRDEVIGEKSLPRELTTDMNRMDNSRSGGTGKAFLWALVLTGNCCKS